MARTAKTTARPTTEVEDTIARRLCGPIAGVDEVGRGAWAGPVVAAALVLPDAGWPLGITDSKAVPPARRTQLAERIREISVVGVGIIPVRRVDEIGVGKATFEAMVAAIEALPLRPAAAIVDGTAAPALPQCQAVTLVKGDQRSMSVAAASIVAKVVRDKIMCSLGETFPAYGWASNKGYGAKAHQLAIEAEGVTIHHRHSFAPIAAAAAAQARQGRQRATA